MVVLSALAEASDPRAVAVANGRAVIVPALRLDLLAIPDVHVRAVAHGPHDTKRAAVRVIDVRALRLGA